MLNSRVVGLFRSGFLEYLAPIREVTDSFGVRWREVRVDLYQLRDPACFWGRTDDEAFALAAQSVSHAVGVASTFVPGRENF